MSHRPRGLLAAALAALACAQPVAAQTISTLPLKGADGNTYQEAGVNDAGGRFYPGHSMFGWNGSALQAVKVDPTTGDIKIICDSGCSGGASGGATQALQQSILTALGSPLQAGGSVSVSNLPATQAVSAAALPLPSGAATASGVAAVVTALGTPLQAGGSVSVSNLPATQAVSAASLPLPAGASTAAGVAAVTTALGSPFQAGGSVANTDFGTRCDVVSADASLTAGAVQRCQMTTTGRVKVGLSSAATNGGPAAGISDLAGATDPSGNQQSLQVDASKRLITAPATVTPDTAAGDFALSRVAQQAIASATGSTTDAAFTGANTASMIALLKAHLAALQAPPLAAGAASAAAQTTGNASLVAIGTSTAADAANNAAFQGEVALTVGGTAVAAGRSLKVICTAAGTITVTYANGSTGVWPVVVGTQSLPLAVTGVASATATATFFNLV